MADDSARKPARKILGVGKSAPARGNTPAKLRGGEPPPTVRSGPRARLAQQRAKEHELANPPAPAAPRKPRPAAPARPPREPRPPRDRKTGDYASKPPFTPRGGKSDDRKPAPGAPAQRQAKPARAQRRDFVLPAPVEEDENEIPPSQRRAPRGYAERRDSGSAPRPAAPTFERGRPAPRQDRPARVERPARRPPRSEQSFEHRAAPRPVAPREPAPPLPAGRFRWFAPCPRGLEQPLARELAECGAESVRAVPGGCQFTGAIETGWQANLQSRIASRVLRELAQAVYRSEHDVYDAARAIDWSVLFAPERTLKVETVAVHSPVKSLEFVTLRVKDAICDRMRDTTGARPDVDTRHPDVRVHVFLDASVATFYIDTSGEALFKRGWRQDKVAAPLRENLAAGLLALLCWTPDTPLLDPFCGSGTIAIEAALIARQQPPGLEREFGFERLADFDVGRWQALRDAARASVRSTPDDGPARIYASDISITAVPIARANAEHAGVQLEIKQVDARHMQPPCEQPGLIVCNPPYGERVQVRGKASRAREHRPDDDAAFFAEFASTLKHRFAGWRVAILSSDPELPRKLRLEPAKAWPLFNGALACKLYVFDIVAGSNRR